MDVTVIICAYTEDRWNDLLEAAASVQRQSLPARQLIVVIDHNPELLARAREHLPFATVIENSHARGSSGGRNSGLALAHTEIVAFMDEDACAEPNWLEMLVAPYQDPAVIGVGGLVRPLWETGRPDWFPEEYDWVVGCSHDGTGQQAGAVRNFIGANMSFRRSAFDAAGPFADELGRLAAFPISCDETEFCIRLRQRCPDGKLVIEPRARVLHRVPASRTTWDYFRLRCYAEGLSKAQVTQFAGAGDGLANERTYVLRTLTAALGKNLKSLLLETDRDAGARAGALLAGLAITAAGYGRGRWNLRGSAQRVSSSVQSWQAEEVVQ